MATTRVEFVDTDGWTLIAASSATEFLIENMTAVPVEVAFAGSAPAANSEAFHLLKKNQTITRVAAGNVYGRTKYDGDTAAVAVTV